MRATILIFYLYFKNISAPMPAQMQTSSRIILTPRITDNLHGLSEVGHVIYYLYPLERCVFNTSKPLLYDTRSDCRMGRAIWPPTQQSSATALFPWCIEEGEWRNGNDAIGEDCRVERNWSRGDFFYTECTRRNVPDFGRVFLMLKYTDITQNTFIQSWTVMEIMAREKCGLLAGPRTVPFSWQVL
jgi:hypothetical protein